MTVFFGIDPAKCCGWARVSVIWDPLNIEVLSSGSTRIDWDGACTVLGKGPEREKAPEYMASLLGLEMLIAEHVEVNDVICYEEVQYHTGIDSAHFYAGLRTVIRLRAHFEGLHCIGVPVATGKQCLTGRGDATKEESVIAVYKRFNIVCATHDEADAIGIALGGARLWKAARK